MPAQNATRSSRIVMSSEPPRRMLPPPTGGPGGRRLLQKPARSAYPPGGRSSIGGVRPSPAVAEVHAGEHRLGALHGLGDLGHVLGHLGVDLGEQELVEGLVGPHLEPVLVHVLAEGELPGEQGHPVVGGHVQPVGEVTVAGQGEGPGAVPFLLGQAETEQSQLVVEGHVPGILAARATNRQRWASAAGSWPCRLGLPCSCGRGLLTILCRPVSAGRRPTPGLTLARHTADLDALVGRTLGRRRYEVVARIAQGGMAIVYRGHDRHLDRVVAIKVPRPEFARDREFSEQFRREARTAARLSHPNVVAVYDSGEEKGLPWIVMEHVDGRTLRDLLDSQRRLSPETTAELLGPVADALDHAHHAGVVHLDVKPENLLLTSETVKVADFGLVRAAAQRGHGQALAATVHYCAPEVLRGGVVDGRADVYALGVVAWECVSGRPPFEGDPRQVVSQHLGGRVPRPSQVVDGIEESFDAAVARATDPDPTRRFLRASDFAAAMGAPRRRRVDETLRATTRLPAGPDTTAAWAQAAGAAAAGPAPAGAPTTGWPPEGQATAAQGWAGQGQAATRSLNGWPPAAGGP